MKTIKKHLDYNENKQPILKYSCHSKWQTKYKYDSNNNNLIKETIINKDNNEEFTTTYEYNRNGQLLRTTNYNNIVKENVYNDKGRIIKTLTYHKCEPACIFFEEHNLDDNEVETTLLTN